VSRVHWLALASVPGLGPVTAARLIERFGRVEAVFDATESELLAVPQCRLTPDMARRIRTATWEQLEAELTSMVVEGLQVFTWDDPEYPANLFRLNNRPIVLFARGTVQAGDAAAVAIVGTREPSEPGRRLAHQLAGEMAGRDLTVVSGLAMGIDTAAHRGALDAAGRTLAVLGAGLRQPVHPRQNTDLAKEIEAHGGVLSELMPGEPLRKSALMIRDRIVSGLSRALVVVEAQEKSGSLDTAAKARSQGCAVYAVPGSPGTRKLLAEGAELLEPKPADLDRLSQRVQSWEASKPSRDVATDNRGPAQLNLF
jgi:DNA processing protein